MRWNIARAFEMLFEWCRILAVIARLDRAIQYSAAVVIESIGRGVLDAPVKPGHDTED
jgi:hypothetical protein